MSTNKPVKRQFLQEWQFWVVFAKNMDGIQYEIEPIIKFNSPELFYQYFSSLPSVSKFRFDQDNKISIAAFSNSIKPAWEDAKNKDGGELFFTLQRDNKNDTQDETIIDKLWRELLICAVSGKMDRWILEEKEKDKEEKDKDFKLTSEKLEVNGILVSPKRPGFVFEVWTKSYIPECPEELKKFVREIVGADVKIISRKHGEKKKK